MLKTNLGKLINGDALTFIIITKIIPIKAYTDIIITNTKCGKSLSFQLNIEK
ncbi:hypothetical protein [Spiroplasma citri]|uniref:hypothetical protein n=1 Tax=Spiroplasma citri TaxID=2133 RepID=UPI002478E048|nr:hypothetical protein [Spiroplasma citri]